MTNMRRRLAVSLMLWFATISSSAQAQFGLIDQPNAKALKVVWDTASCMTKQKEALVVDFLATPIGSKPSTDFSHAMKDCLTEAAYEYEQSSLKLNLNSLRGALAQAFLRKHPPVTPLALSLTSPTGTQFDNQQAELFIDDTDKLGLCVARSQPGMVENLILSKPDSVVEANIFKQLGAAMSACLPSGWKMSMPPANMRQILALGLYKITMITPVPGPTGKAN